MDWSVPQDDRDEDKEDFDFAQELLLGLEYQLAQLTLQNSQGASAEVSDPGDFLGLPVQCVPCPPTERKDQAQTTTTSFKTVPVTIQHFLNQKLCLVFLSSVYLVPKPQEAGEEEELRQQSFLTNPIIDLTLPQTDLDEELENFEFDEELLLSLKDQLAQLSLGNLEGAGPEVADSGDFLGLPLQCVPCPPTQKKDQSLSPEQPSRSNLAAVDPTDPEPEDFLGLPPECVPCPHSSRS